MAWRSLPTADNPADLASRGGHVEKADLWWDGPRWLASPELWPTDVLNKPSEERQTEAKLVQKVMGVAVNEENEVEEVLHKFQLQKAVRVCAWMRRFARNSLRSRGTPRVLGPLTTEETTPVSCSSWRNRPRRVLKVNEIAWRLTYTQTRTEY